MSVADLREGVAKSACRCGSASGIYNLTVKLESDKICVSP